MARSLAGTRELPPHVMRQIRQATAGLPADIDQMLTLLASDRTRVAAGDATLPRVTLGAVSMVGAVRDDVGAHRLRAEHRDADPLVVVRDRQPLAQ